MPLVSLRIYVIAILLIVAGCAGQVKMLPTLAPETIINDDQGIVVARVINASAYSLPFNQLTITPKNLNESKEVKLERLIALRPRMKGTTVFSSPVASGTYALNSIRSFHSNGNFWYDRFVSADARFGVFTVAPGTVTDLGTLIYYPKSQDDKYLNILLRAPNTELGEVLAKHFAFYDLSEQLVTSWDEDSRDDERAAVYASVAQNPINYNTRYLSPDNSLYFLTKLGVIITRSAEGEWAMDAVDTNLELTTIAQNGRGDLITGGGEGALFWKPAGGQWQDISLGSDYKIEKVLFNTVDTVDVIASQKTTLSILRAPLTGGPFDWQLLNQYSFIEGWQSIPKPAPKKEASIVKKPLRPKVIVGVKLLEHEGKSLITVREISERYDPVFNKTNSKTYQYNPADGRVQLLDKEPDISTVIDAGKIKLGIKYAGFWSWNGRPDYLRYIEATGAWEKISTHIKICPGNVVIRGNICPVIPASVDEADSKAKKKKIKKNEVKKPRRKSFSFQSVPVFKSEMEGIAVVGFRNVNVWTGRSTRDVKLVVTDDGGKTWLLSDNKLPYDYCSAFIPEVTDRLLVSCNGSSGDFYESFDQGKKWQHVREHENF